MNQLIRRCNNKWPEQKKQKETPKAGKQRKDKMIKKSYERCEKDTNKIMVRH